MKRTLYIFALAFAVMSIATAHRPARAGAFNHLRVSYLRIGASAETAQDFQKEYRIGTGGTVAIHNVSGNIVVKGYDGDAVVVSGIREGRDRDQVEIEDLSSGNRVDIHVRYPNCRSCDAGVRFEVRVPRSQRLNIDPISTASGNIEVSDVTAAEVRVNTASGDVLVKDVTGAIRANTASGEMKVRNAAGSVSAQSASGNVEVELTRLEGTDNMKFSSASGDVNVRVPSNLDAEVDMSSFSGSVKTNFPLEVENQRYGPGGHARGRIGSGARRLHVSSASGNVSLTSF